MKILKQIHARHMLPVGDVPLDHPMPAALDILRHIGNVKAASADDARRTRRILLNVRDTKEDLILENEDLAFLIRTFEKNDMNLTAWMQGQILDILDSAENTDRA